MKNEAFSIKNLGVLFRFFAVFSGMEDGLSPEGERK
jgi:hypothetical protein